MDCRTIGWVLHLLYIGLTGIYTIMTRNHHHDPGDFGYNNYTLSNYTLSNYQEYLPGTIIVRTKYILCICNVRIHTNAIVCSLSLVLALGMVLLVCACAMRVVGMGLRFHAVLCGLCGSSVVGVAGGLWVVPGFV